MLTDMCQKMWLLFLESKFRFFLFFYIFLNFSYCIFEEKRILANSASVVEVSGFAYFNPFVFDSYLFNIYLSKTNLFEIPELKSNSLCFKVNTPFVKFSFVYNHLMHELYNENFFYSGLWFSFKDKIFFGVNPKFLNTYTKNYGYKFYSTTDIGVFCEVLSYLNSGFIIKNMFILNSNEDLDKQLIFSNKFKIFKILTSYLDVVKPKNDFLFFKIAQEISLSFYKQNDMFIRFGVETANSHKLPKLSSGVGFLVCYSGIDLTFDYSFVYTPYLGNQHLFSFGASFIKIKRNFKKHLIDLNTATEEELKKVPGIGNKIAKRIIEYRQKYGKFNSIYELIYIPGITEEKLREIEKFLFVEQKDEVKEE